MGTGRSSFPPLAIGAQLRWDVVRTIIQRLAPRSTIEIGTGQGAMGARIAAMTAGPYLGFELDETSHATAQRRIAAEGGMVHCAALAEVDPTPADLCCAFEVLEHAADDGAALAEWVRYVAPGGHLVLSVPAGPERFGAWDEFVGHFRRYSPDGLTTLVRNTGLVDVRTTVYGAPLGYGLEAARNRIGTRKLAAAKATGTPIEELTAASGRQFQFENASWKSAMATAVAVPFTYLQRVWPGGVGMVVAARRPRS